MEHPRSLQLRCRYLVQFPAAFLLCGLLLSCDKAEVVSRDGPQSVPEEFFGVRLGTVFDFTETTDATKVLPIKKFAGAQASLLGVGAHWYFQPLEENEYFGYREERKTPGDEFFTTSHHLYLIPVLPDSVKSMDELLRARERRWEVVKIGWVSRPEGKDAPYWAAIDLCKTLAVGLSVKPEILDSFDSKTYSCTFGHNDRQLRVHGFVNLLDFALEFKNDVLETKEKEVEDFARRLKARDILKK